MSKTKETPVSGTLESIFATVKRCSKKTKINNSEPVPAPSLSEIQEYTNEIDRWFYAHQFRLETGEVFVPQHHGKRWWLLDDLNRLTIDVMHSAGCIPMAIHQTVDDRFICLYGFLDEHNWRDSDTTHGGYMTDDEAKLQLSFYNLALPLCLLEDGLTPAVSTSPPPQAQVDPPAVKKRKPGPKVKNVDGEQSTFDDWKQFHEAMKASQKANPDGEQKTLHQWKMDYCHDRPEVGTVTDLARLIDRVRKRQ